MTTLHVNYNSYNFEIKFKKYLESNDFSRISIHNYLADVRSFLSWFSRSLKQEHMVFDLSLFNEKTIRKYIDFLSTTNTPSSTINRGLSSLRKFSEFLIEEKYVDINPMTGINNVKTTLSGTFIIATKKNGKPTLAFIFGFFFFPGLFWF